MAGPLSVEAGSTIAAFVVMLIAVNSTMVITLEKNFLIMIDCLKWLNNNNG
jgi:hypothetical protein